MDISRPKLIRVLVVDNHYLVRFSIRSTLGTVEDITIVGEADNGATAHALCAQLDIDAVILDLVMPGLDGVETARLICRDYPHIRILIFTSSPDDDYIQAALDAGAHACIIKSVRPGELITAIYSLFEPAI